MNCNKKIDHNTLISVIVTTYNWPEAVILCLKSLYAQTDQNFEIIVADDGSTDENVACLKALLQSSPVAVQYVWHEDLGFRAAMIRNKAVAASQGEYLLFIDGDCVLFPDFIFRHRRLAEKGFFVPGNRILLSESFTQEVFEHAIDLQNKSVFDYIWLCFTRKINRILALLTLPLGFLRKIRPQKWQQAMTCNLGVWCDDFKRVNGFDEVFAGWGYEDSDLVIRLIHAGIMRKEGRFATAVLHLWHRQNDRNQHDDNLQRLIARLGQRDLVSAHQGISQYLA